MQWGRSSNTLIERAKEELEILDYQHPTMFDCLKLELKAFISELESHKNTTSISPSTSAATQESSSRKKRKKDADVAEASARKVGSCIKRRCKTDAVLERAQECLHKIQHFKSSLC